MPDIYDVVQTIRQFGMARYCGVKPSHWAYDFMLETQNAGIGLIHCLKSFEAYMRNRYA